MPQDESIERLRRGLLRLGDEVSRLRTQMERLQQRTDQLFALRQAEPETAPRLEQLETVLDFDRVAAHVQTAVAQAPLTLDPVPHISVQDVFPAAVYRALVDAIPPVVFFEGDDDRALELRVPPRTGPVPSIVTWAFASEVALRALSPALVARFESPLAAFARTRFPSLPPFQEWGVDIALSQGRIVRRRPGAAEGPPPDRPWEFLTCVVALARPHDPFPSNTALVFLGPPQTFSSLPIPESAPSQTEWYTYEFGIGPTREGRRALTAKMSQHDAAIWSTGA